MTAPDDTASVETMNTFEACGQENGSRYWWASDLCQVLGYKPGKAFDKAVGRAMASCTAIGVPVIENFRQEYRGESGDQFVDTKLSRFACYLIAMNGDPSKPEVARAQAYFITWAHAAEQLHAQIEGVQRVAIRDELVDGEKALNSAAKAAGIENYAFFQNQGYRGLYNMTLARMRELKGLPENRTPLDFMGKEEMAANLFRITQTEGKIRNDRVRGQRALEATAFEVGQAVRKTIKKIGGTMPEDLPAQEDIKKVRSGLKQANKSIQNIDQPKKLPAVKKKPKN